MWTLVGCALAALHAPQEPASPPAGEPIAELRGLPPIRAADYAAWLVAWTGGARVEEMLRDVALTHAAARIPGDEVPEDLRPTLEDPERVARAAADEHVAVAHGGDRARWLAELASRGTTPDEALRSAALAALREARVELLVRRARRATDDDLRALFEERFGPSGVRTRARHLLVGFADVRARLAAEPGGPAVDAATVRSTARREADDLAARARTAGSLEGLAAAPLPDGLVRFGGTALASALAELPVGTVSEPIESRFGYHVVEVEARAVTRYEEVEAELRELWRNAPPTLAERRALDERLDAEFGIRDALERRVRR